MLICLHTHLHMKYDMINSPVAYFPTTDDFFVVYAFNFRRSMRRECISTTKSMKRKHQNLGPFSKMGEGWVMGGGWFPPG